MLLLEVAPCQEHYSLFNKVVARVCGTVVLDYTVTLSYNVPCTNEDGSICVLMTLLENLQAIILINTKLQREIMLLLANNVHEKHHRESRNFESVRVIRRLHSS